jgi:hypothetical protein
MFSYNYFRYFRRKRRVGNISSPEKKIDKSMKVHINYIYDDGNDSSVCDQVRYDSIIYDSSETKSDDVVMHETPFTKFCDISFENSDTFVLRYDSLKYGCISF